ncbi:MAG: NAD-dependent epimerase/dehydratase family protein [Anaerosomatales bacterium]|nr:NAD-dependent epimerase/dehydratase family protein [Anaerosomatales bacterium]
MRVLVTGGAGFIGSNLVWSLVGAGHEVHVVDDLSTGSLENLHPAANMRTLDVTDSRFIDAVREIAPEVIVHLAAQTSVPVSVREPERDWRINVGGTRAVARAAKACGARKLLSASSAAVYGEPAEIPLRETAQKRPTNPYGSSKLEAERVLAEELRGSGVDFASLRFSNVYGPRQDWRGEGGVVALFSAAMTSGRPPVVLGTGAQTRDFIYVGDVVGAILAALESPVLLAGEGDDGPAYNISTGTETSIDMLVAHLRAATRYGGPVEHGPEREGDIARSALDPSKAREVFGWEARVPLETGLAMTVKWFGRGA